MSVTIGGGFLVVPLSSWNKVFDLVPDLDSLGKVTVNEGGGAIDFGVFNISGSSESVEDWRS